MNFNKVVIAGNLTRDPEPRTMPSGQTVVNFSIATNRVWTDQSGQKQEAADFHNIVAFGKLADICARYLNKGRLVLIEGRLQTRSWQDQSGNKRSRTEIIAENMQMGPRSAGSQAPAANQTKHQLDQSSKDDIPVIEADELTTQSFSVDDTEQKEEIDVKNIPF